MSRKRSAVALAIFALIALTGAGAAQNSGASPDTAIVGGLAENSWNFTDPDSIPGFGTMPQDFDTTRLRPEFSK